jgi:glycosyltransferase involved in cell wall biosynthesis
MECTYVFEHPHQNTGIQRVVKNILKNAPKNQSIPIVILDNQIFELKDLSCLYRFKFWDQVKNKVENPKRKIRAKVAEPWASMIIWILKKIFPIYRLCRFFVSYIRSLFKKPTLATQAMVPLEPKDGDTLLLLDSSWHSDFLGCIKDLKDRHNLTVISVIYDLIPLTHSQFCSSELVPIFTHWLNWVSMHSHGFIGISRAVKDEIQSYVKTQNRSSPLPWFDFFYLGSDMSACSQKGNLPGSGPFYLMVGTIEPRKNQFFAIEAFEGIWAQGVDLQLWIVGRIGWLCGDQLAKIRNHPQYKKNLFLFDHFSDSELDEAYKNARALIMPSVTEGFGLPIVEALSRGCPVMASDIPIFREIGGDHLAYFDLDSPQSLSQLVQKYETSGTFPAQKPIKDWSWISWEEATRNIFAILGRRGLVSTLSSDN